MGLIKFKISIETGLELIIIQEVTITAIAYPANCFGIGDQMVEISDQVTLISAEEPVAIVANEFRNPDEVTTYDSNAMTHGFKKYGRKILPAE